MNDDSRFAIFLAELPREIERLVRVNREASQKIADARTSVESARLLLQIRSDADARQSAQLLIDAADALEREVRADLDAAELRCRGYINILNEVRQLLAESWR